MDSFELIADKRDDTGKGASRRLRREGLVPGIVYGGAGQPVNLQLVGKDLWKQLDNEAFYSHILTLKIGGVAERVVLKDLQRHPYKQQLTHVDFLRVVEGEALTMNCPVHFTNEDKCPGKKAGGVISHLLTELEITCLPRDLPEYIEVDVSELEVGDTIHLGDLKMPAGVRIAALEHEGDPMEPVVSVVMPRAEKGAGDGDEDEEEAAAGDGED